MPLKKRNPKEQKSVSSALNNFMRSRSSKVYKNSWSSRIQSFNIHPLADTRETEKSDGKKYQGVRIDLKSTALRALFSGPIRFAFTSNRIAAESREWQVPFSASPGAARESCEE